ncbi:MFS transporter [Beijerinckia mobilis]|uniref:MFS transporter n=1 Tax=Beijerinckia mobilis TaxID=231434 RepID=UPI00068BC0B2|nr:MFS transporter [Beijerinckia mobilis]
MAIGQGAILPIGPFPAMSASLRLIGVVALTFLGFFAVGLPLAVLPAYIDHDLGLGAFWAGVAMSAQYVVTIISRPRIGQLTDRFGPKPAVLYGFAGYVVAGLLTMASVPAASMPLLSFLLLLGSRLALGLGESCVGNGAIFWAMTLLGPKETVRIIAWNGIATNAALASSAPVGAVIAADHGLGAIGAATVAVAFLGLLLAGLRPGVQSPVSGEPGGTPAEVFRIVAPYGLTLALAGTGFGVIISFIALYFESRHWPNAAFALTTFGLSFMSLRPFLARAVERFGGVTVARTALLVELAGMALLIAAPTPILAMIGTALTGFGYSAIFPSLGGDAIGRAPPANRAVALALYSVFQDVSLGAVGPIAGMLITRYGYGAPFWFALAAIISSILISLRLKPFAPRPQLQSLSSER